jgi:hypothetical protein
MQKDCLQKYGKAGGSQYLGKKIKILITTIAPRSKVHLSTFMT